MNQDRSKDEQVYQDNKSEPAVREVYSNENDRPAVEAGQDTAERADQDETLAETFPASDPPATSSSVPKPQDES